MHDTASSETANRPPKPQHSSGRESSVSSMPSSDAQELGAACWTLGLGTNFAA